MKDLDLVEKILINKCIYGTIDKPVNCTLHGFSDASVKAYCSVVFPIKAQTIPRQELMAALILARLMSTGILVRGAQIEMKILGIQ